MKSKHTATLKIGPDCQHSYVPGKDVEQKNFTPEHAFQCNIAEKVKKFGFMNIDEALKDDPITVSECVNEIHNKI